MVSADGDSAAPPRQTAVAQAALHLPDELVVSVLEFLGLADLRAAAAVDRQFYQSAWRAGLYIERTYSCDGEKDMGTEAQTWTELVDHALRKELQLALAFTCLWLNSSPEEHSTITSIIHSIQRSLPVLVALSVNLGNGIFKDVYTALQHPAPRLRSLRLARAPMESVEGTAISFGLFSGDAPRLCELGLGCLIDNTRGIPAFANVVRVLTYLSMDGVRLSLGSLFPNLAHLYVCSSGSEPEVPAQTFDLSGVALRTLVFKDTRLYTLLSAERKSLGDRHVPIVHHLLNQPKNMDWRCPLGWVVTGGSIHVRLKTADLGFTVFVAPADCLWRRSYTFRATDPGSPPLQLCDMPGICTRLTYLRVHCDAALALLQCVAEYAALTSVRVDIAPSHDMPVPLFRRIAREQLVREAEPRVRCPMLTGLALAAQSLETVAVAFSDVAFLCRALGTVEKPALELCGVAVQCERGEALEDLFARVSRLPDGGMHCSVFDGAIWDDHAAVVSDTFIRTSLAH